MSTSQMLNEEMVARMEELLLENMRLTVRAEEAEEELAEVEEEKDSWEDRVANQEEEIDQLSSLLERAQLSHVDQRKEIKELKAEVARLKGDQVAASL